MEEAIYIPEKNQEKWLRETARDIFDSTIAIKNPTFPEVDEDEVYTYHRAFLHMGFLYCNLRDCIRYEDGPQIITMWRYWLLHLLRGHKVNYAHEAANLLANLEADWPPEIAFIHTHCRTVNVAGKPGHGKPVDQLIEHYNL